MNISALRRVWNGAMYTRDAETMLTILDKLYYNEEFDLFEEWKFEATPLLREIQQEQEDYLQTEKRVYG